MHLTLVLAIAAYLATDSINAELKTIKYYCDGSGGHVAVKDICRNACWGAVCLNLGWTFTFSPQNEDENRDASGYKVPSSANKPCGPDSLYGDATRDSIDEFPLASSINPTNIYSLRCAANQPEQRSQGGSVTASSAKAGDQITFQLVGGNANTLGVDWCDPNPACENDGFQFQLQGNNYVQSIPIKPNSGGGGGGDDGSSPLTPFSSTPTPPSGSLKRDLTAWVRSLANTVRVHARAWR